MHGQNNLNKMDLTSKKANIQAPDSNIFNMLINCNNIGKYIPKDKVQDFQSTETTCSFTVPGAGKIEMSLQEKVPDSLVSYSLGNAMAKDVSVIFHIENQGSNSSDFYITSHLDVPFFMAQMIKSSLQKFVDMLVDYIKIEAERNNSIE